MGPRAVGAAGRGRLFDGMESWLPWLADGDTLLTDLLPATAKVVLVEPRRMRDRATDLLAEEADLARTLASTWARDADRTFPRLHADFDRLLGQRRSRRGRSSSTPEHPDAPMVQAIGLGPGRRRRRRARPSGSPSCSPTGTASSSPPTAPGQRDAPGRAAARPRARLHRSSTTTTDLDQARRPRSSSRRSTAAARCRRPSWRSSPRPTSPAAAAPTASHGRASAQGAGFFEDLKPGDYVVHHQHGVGRYEGMVKRTIGGVERDYLLLEYKGGDKLYVPTDQIDARAPVHRRRGARRCTASAAPTSRRPRHGCAVAVREIAQELVVLYQKRVNAAGPRLRPATRRGSTRWRTRFPYEETPDQRKAIDDVKADMERPYPMDRLRVRRRRLRQDRGRDPRRVQGGAGRQAGRGARARPRCSPRSTARRSASASPATRCGSRCSAASSPPSAGQARWSTGCASGEVDCVIGTHRLLAEDVKFKDLGLLVVDEEQRFGVQHKEAIKKLKTNVDVLTLTATPIPRTLEMSLTGIRDLIAAATRRRPTASRSSPTSASTTSGSRSRRSAASCCARARCSSCTTGCRTSSSAAARLRELVPEARIAVAHGQMDEGTLEQVVVDFWEGELRRARVHDDHRERHRHADGEHARRRPRRPARARPAAPAARPRRPQRASGPTPTCSTRATARSPRRPTSG